MATIGIDASRANRRIKTGTEWYSYYLIQELKKITANDNNRYILFTDRRLEGDLAVLPKNWQERILPWPPKFLWTQVRFSLEMLFRPVNILFIPAHAIPIIHPKNTVTTIHDLGFEKFPQVYSPWQRFYYRFVHQYAAQWAKKIIVPSEFTKKELVCLYETRPEKIEVIHFGYNSQIFKVIKDQNKINQVLKKYGIKKPYLLYVGRIEIKKGIETLLQAYLELRIQNSEFSLVLVGQPGYGYVNLKSQISNLKSVKELGYLTSEEERACLYNGAEVFVFPSLYEGFGLPILEALACGCPVVASNVEPIREILVGKYLDCEKQGAENLVETLGNSAILVLSEKPKEMAKKIKMLMNNQELRNDLIKNGLECVKNFSWRKCAERTLVVLLSFAKI